MYTQFYQKKKNWFKTKTKEAHQKIRPSWVAELQTCFVFPRKYFFACSEFSTVKNTKDNEYSNQEETIFVFLFFTVGRKGAYQMSKMVWFVLYNSLT